MSSHAELMITEPSSHHNCIFACQEVSDAPATTLNRPWCHVGFGAEGPEISGTGMFLQDTQRRFVYLDDRACGIQVELKVT